MIAIALLSVTGYAIVDWLVIAVIVGAALGIAYAVLRHFGITIPPVLMTIFWILVVCVVAVVAIRLLVGLAF